MEEANLEDLQITPQDLKEKMSTKDKFLLVDVREPWEAKIAQIPGSMLIPMKQVPENLGVLEGAQEVIVYCHHGIRSARAVEFLRAAGLRARNLKGGISAWTDEVDPTLIRY